MQTEHQVAANANPHCKPVDLGTVIKTRPKSWYPFYSFLLTIQQFCERGGVRFVPASLFVFFLHSVANNNSNTSCCCVQSEADSDVSYRLSLYKDADYKHELSSFPAAVDDKQRLYIRASVTAGFSSSLHTLTHTRLTALCPGLSR